MLTLTRSGLTLNLNASVVPATGSSNVPILYMEEISDDYTGYLVEPRIGFTQNGKYTEFIGTYEEETQSVIIPAQCFANTGSVDITIALIDPEDPDHVEVCTPKKFSVTKAPMGTVVLPEEPTWQDYVLNYMKQNLDKLQGPQGDKGEPGDNATINVGSVTTLEPGQEATVTNTGTETNAVLNFGIPKGEKGDKGDKGDTGPQGIQGPKGETGPQGSQGDKGDKGDKGDTGEQGPQGTKGDTGEQGPQGPQGEVGPQGPQGEKGDTGEQGPKGDKGDAGDNATIAIGTVTTLEPDQEATVQNTGTETNAVLAFGIPKGVQGDIGPQGPQGAPGVNENVPHADISKSENPSVDDAYGTPLQDLKLYGKSTQVSTTGKNLLPFPFPLLPTGESKTIDGLTATANSDGSVSVTGTKTIAEVVYFDLIIDKEIATKGSITASPTGTDYYCFYDSANGHGGIAIKTSKAVNFKMYPMLEVGESVTAYEPYTGGQPSPSPDYPQEITCIEEVDCLITGANLFDKETITDNAYVTDDTGLVIDDNEQIRVASDYINVDGLSNIYITDTDKSRWGAFYNSDKEYISGFISTGSINVPENAKYLRFTVPKTNIDTFMINAGTQALPYEPYKSQHVQFTPPAPLYSILDGSIADYVDVVRGKYVYQLTDVTFDGSEDEAWEEYDYESSGYHGVLIRRTDMKVAMRQSGFCDKLTIARDATTTTSAWLGVNNNYIYLPYADTFAGTANSAEFKTWLATNNLRFIYPLATPIEQDIPAETLEALQALKTFNGVTNIFCNAPVSAQYEQSVQIVMNKILEQLNKLQTQTLNLQEEMINNV